MIYNIPVSSVTLAAGASFLTVVPGAARSFLIIEIDAQGMGNSSAPNEFGIFSVGTAGSGAGTPTAYGVNPTDSPNISGGGSLAFSGNAFIGYASTPPVAAALRHNVPLNSNGQRYWWRCNTNYNDAILVPGNSKGITCQQISGTGTVTLRLKISEM